jgi:streptogramin lyase
VTTDAEGNVLFADLNSTIRRIDVHTGTIETLAGTGIEGFSGDGGPAIAAALARPRAVVADGSGTVYLADESLRIRRIDATSGVISTYAGTGSLTPDYEGSEGRPAIEADLGVISAMSLAADGTLYFDLNRRVVAKIDPTTGTLSRIAGQHEHTNLDSGDGGPALEAKLTAVKALAVDTSGDLYVATNYRVHKVDTETGVISTIAGAGYGPFSGDGGAAVDAYLSDPAGLWVDADGNVLVADQGNHRLRRIEETSGVITTVAGGHVGDGGTALEASFSGSFSVAQNGGILIADDMNYRVRRIDAESGHISTVAGTGIQRETSGLISSGPAREVRLWHPKDVVTDSHGTIYITDGVQVLRLDPQSGQLAAFAGNGQYGAYGGDGKAALEIAMFPSAIAAGPHGDLYVTGAGVVSLDWGRVLKVDAATGIISTVAGGDSLGFSGDGGPAVEAQLRPPKDLLVTGAGDLYIADGSRVRYVDGASGRITTIAGNGDSDYHGDGGPAIEAGLEEISAMALDDGGNLFLFSGLRVRKVDANTGIITTVAGNGQFGDSGDGGSALQASLFPGSLGVDRSGGLLIGGLGRIRRVAEVATAVVNMESVWQRPLRATLHQNYPNPFNSGTNIRIDLPRSQKIELRVYNMAGQRVASLASGHHTTGNHSLYWDGRDDEGRDLASGVYLYRLITGRGQVQTRKFVLLR